MTKAADKPDWDRLYEIGASQDGHFMTVQAAQAGYSPQLLAKHLKSRRIRRVSRGIYRIVHYPAGDHEDLAVLWLWSEREGVFSHETALTLHELSDVLPSKTHMTVPSSWKTRRLRVPGQLVLHFSDLEEEEKAWHESVPVTSSARTLCDCAAEDFSPDLLRQALQQGIERGLFIDREVRPVEDYLYRFEENGT